MNSEKLKKRLIRYNRKSLNILSERLGIDNTRARTKIELVDLLFHENDLNTIIKALNKKPIVKKGYLTKNLAILVSILGVLLTIYFGNVTSDEQSALPGSFNRPFESKGDIIVFENILKRDNLIDLQRAYSSRLNYDNYNLLFDELKNCKDCNTSFEKHLLARLYEHREALFDAYSIYASLFSDNKLEPEFFDNFIYCAIFSQSERSFETIAEDLYKTKKISETVLAQVYIRLGENLKCIELYKENSYLLRLTDSIQIGKAYRKLSNDSLAILVYHQLEKSFPGDTKVHESLDSLLSYAELFNGLGVLYESKEEYGAAWRCYKQSEKLLEKIGKSMELMPALYAEIKSAKSYNIALLYNHHLGNHKEALLYLENVVLLEDQSLSSNNPTKEYALTSLAITYLLLDRNKEAYDNFKVAYDLRKKEYTQSVSNSHDYFRTKLNYALGLALILDFESSAQVLKEVEHMILPNSDPSDQEEFLILALQKNKGILNYYMGDYENSLHHFNLALEHSLRIGRQRIQVEIYYYRALIFSKTCSETEFIENCALGNNLRKVVLPANHSLNRKISRLSFECPT